MDKKTQLENDLSQIEREIETLERKREEIEDTIKKLYPNEYRPLLTPGMRAKLSDIFKCDNAFYAIIKKRR